VHVAAIVVGLAAAAAADWRWLLVAQREHYLPGSATRFALRWWRIGPNRVLGAAAVIGVVLSPLTPVPALVAAVAVAVGPFGFPLRPRSPGPMAWTARLRTVAVTVAVAQAIVAAAAIVLGAGTPVVAALALVEYVRRLLGSDCVALGLIKVGRSLAVSVTGLTSAVPGPTVPSPCVTTSKA